MAVTTLAEPKKEGAKTKLNIVLYAVRPDQEYTDLRRRESWDNTWDNGSNYSDWGYQNAKVMGTEKPTGVRQATRGMSERKFGEVIRIRKDGFVYNDVNEAIFHADSAAIEVLKSLKDMTVMQVRNERPDVAEVLML